MNYINNFIVDGKTYCTGTVFIIENRGKQVEASFICYDVEHELFLYKIGKCTWMSHDKYFNDHFIAVTDRIDPNIHMPVEKKMKDSQIEGLFFGWIWYIFLMAVSVIFKDAIGLWILFSVVFFSWRHKKIKKEGTYVEW